MKILRVIDLLYTNTRSEKIKWKKEKNKFVSQQNINGIGIAFCLEIWLSHGSKLDKLVLTVENRHEGKLVFPAVTIGHLESTYPKQTAKLRKLYEFVALSTRAKDEQIDTLKFLQIVRGENGAS